MRDVVLVQMPFAALERPSLALGLLSSSLRAAGLPARSEYLNLAFAQRVGLTSYALVTSAWPDTLLGEWVFGPAAFGPAAAGLPALGDVADRLYTTRAALGAALEAAGADDLAGLLADLRAQAEAFVDEAARHLLASQPAVVACTSMFDQHVASLALLQRVKALAPQVLTVVGGANCHGPMGRATHLAFPAVDFTVTGECDEFAADFFRALLAAEGRPERVGAVPAGVLTPAHRGQPDLPEPAAVPLADLDRAARPDYDDYFEQLALSPLGPHVLPSLPLETSRGCWWGAKQHCTFCGLNAEGMAFRRKSPERAVDEIRTLTRRYGVFRFAAADNIIDMSYFDSVLPALAGDLPRYNGFYETKANLKGPQVEALAAAGCRFIQPGIESLHDATLRLMRKGTSACQNIRLLQHCLEAGVLPSWSILCGFPGSDASWVAEVAAEFDALLHLPPPLATVPIRFDRFSPYHQRPAAYGLELEPLPSYAQVYPLPAEVLRDLAYFFGPRGGVSAEVLAGVQLASQATSRWIAHFWGPRRACLTLVDDETDRLHVLDTRGDGDQHHHLRGLAARVLRLLEEPASDEALARRLTAAGVDATAEAQAAALAELRERRLVWRSSTQYLALPTRPPRRPLPPRADTPVGHLDLAGYIRERARAWRVPAGA